MSDTIFALSSGGLPSGVAIVRLSGGSAVEVAKGLQVNLARATQFVLSGLYEPVSGELIDRALVVWFKAPSSFTGEDVVEFHCHGSRATIANLLFVLGKFDNCRLAEAGEFSRRAFENGKLDLTEVEGLADLIGP